jgi:hypothetical protein
VHGDILAASKMRDTNTKDYFVVGHKECAGWAAHDCQLVRMLTNGRATGGSRNRAAIFDSAANPYCMRFASGTLFSALPFPSQYGTIFHHCYH